MYITSRLPSSFPFNKTYVVAGTKEETTESRRGGCGTACSYTTGYCDCSSGPQWERESASLGGTKEGPRAADHREKAVIGQPHAFALAVTLAS